MRSPKARSTSTGLVTLFAVASLVLVSANPALAAAAVVGAGGGHGWEYPPNHVNNCPNLPPLITTFASDEFDLYHTGTYSATNPQGNQTIALYVGPTTVNIVVGTHVVSPGGVGPTCLVPIGPVPIKTASVNGTLGTGSVNCSYNSGYYTRVNEAVNFTLIGIPGGPSGQCSVNGNTPPLSANVTNVPTNHVITGTMTPCSFPVVNPLDPDNPITFIDNPECTTFAGVNAPRAGGAGSHLITTYVAGGVGVP